MTISGLRLAKGKRHATLAALFSMLLASCTSMPDTSLEMNAAAIGASAGTTGEATGAAPSGTSTQTANLTMSEAGDTALPDQVAYLPAAKPGAGFPTPPEGNIPAPATTADATSAADPAASAQQAATQVAAAAPAQQADQSTAAAAPAAQSDVYVTAGEMPADPIEPKKKGFLSAFFGSTPKSSARTPVVPRAEKPKPVIDMAKAKAQDAEDKPLELASLNGVGIDSGGIGSSALPGVRQTALFEIKRKSGIDDDSDVDLHEEDEEGPIQLASAAGLARLAPNGLLKQTDRVDTACLKPSLVRVLKQIERRYGKRIIVTSGYRSPARNRAARGAKNSLHMYCAAVDIQIPGVDKWELASYARSMPGRGGVGTYCHTNSVHVDVGPERDWNWRCRRRKA